MRLSLGQLRLTVRRVLAEAMGAMKMLDVVQLKLVLSKEKKVEEIMTGIRIIKGVATVSQAEPMTRQPNGTRTMEVLCTFDPGELDVMTYIDAMARLTKTIPDVVTVVIKSLNGQSVRDASGKRKLVY